MVRPRTPSAGFGLIEIMIAAALFATAALALASVVGYGIQLDRVNHETVVAMEAARQRLEEIRGTPLAIAFAEFNADPLDDPSGVGTGVGPTFTTVVEGVGTFQGQVEFPTGAGGALLENVDRPELGMPRDLDGDGAVDAVDRRNDYLVLPVLVRVTWTGATGERQVELHGVLMP